MGIPVSMWVPWMSPFDRASRMAAQLAPLLTVELMPYFLKKPFSWAITIGEQSVRAIIPNFSSFTSGPSLGDSGPVDPAGAAGAAVSVFGSQPPRNVAPARPLAAVVRNLRLLIIAPSPPSSKKKSRHSVRNAGLSSCWLRAVGGRSARRVPRR